MAAIRHSLQQDLFRPNDEALYSVVSVAKISGGKKKKTTFLCATVTKEKPFHAKVYKVQKSEKEVYKKKHWWSLSDLKVVDGIDKKQETLEFDLYFEKAYHWVASRSIDRNEFIETLFMLSKRYCNKNKLPEFKNISQNILDGDIMCHIKDIVTKSKSRYILLWRMVDLVYSFVQSRCSTC